MEKKRALITGITGQDGSYLAEFLLEKGYEVHGLRRRVSVPNLGNLKQIRRGSYTGSFFLHYGDLTDSSSLTQIVTAVKPHEIYNLAAQSHVHTSFQVPEYTAEVNALGAIRLMDAVKSFDARIRVYQASTSELFGDGAEMPQNEMTPFNPVSPYAISKLYAYHTAVNYRDSFGIFATNGILFNHESPRRGSSFVTKKISESVALISLNRLEKIRLGNLDAERDWGLASEYIEAMWLMLQHDEPVDLVIATNESHSVREFVEKAFAVVGKTIDWEGEGIEEKGIDRITGELRVEIDPYYFRPVEVETLLGDASKAKNLINWEAQTGFDDLVSLMVEADLNSLTA